MFVLLFLALANVVKPKVKERRRRIAKKTWNVPTYSDREAPVGEEQGDATEASSAVLVSAAKKQGNEIEMKDLSGSAAQGPKPDASAAAQQNDEYFYRPNGDIEEHRFEYEGDEPPEMTPLHVYAMCPKGDPPPSVKQEDINKRAEYDGLTPLMVASMLGGYRDDVQAGLVKRPLGYDERKEKPNFVKELIDMGADLSLRRGGTLETPLHLAAKFGHGKASSWLMSRGADLNAQDATGRTPLITAAAAGNFHIVDFLLDKSGTDIDAQDDSGRSSMMVAVNYEMEKILDSLLASDKNAKLGLVDKEGKSALHYGASVDNFRAVEKLIRHGARKDAQDHFDQTALFIAADYGSANSVRVLIQNYARRNINDDMNRSPIDVARERGYHDIVEMLEDWTMNPTPPMLGANPMSSSSSPSVQSPKGSSKYSETRSPSSAQSHPEHARVQPKMLYDGQHSSPLAPSPLLHGLGGQAAAAAVSTAFHHHQQHQPPPPPPPPPQQQQQHQLPPYQEQPYMAQHAPLQHPQSRLYYQPSQPQQPQRNRPPSPPTLSHFPLPEEQSERRRRAAGPNGHPFASEASLMVDDAEYNPAKRTCLYQSQVPAAVPSPLRSYEAALSSQLPSVPPQPSQETTVHVPATVHHQPTPFTGYAAGRGHFETDPLDLVLESSLAAYNLQLLDPESSYPDLTPLYPSYDPSSLSGPSTNEELNFQTGNPEAVGPTVFPSSLPMSPYPGQLN